MTTINPDLRHRTLWLVVGYLLIALVIYLSLSSSPVEIDTDLPYQDKLFHFIAYFVLTFWFLQIYHIRHHVIVLVVLFFCLGMTMEYLQGFDTNRYSEVADMIANSLGVMAGVGLSLTPLRYTLMKVERYIG
jgi:VanZ family protein